MAVYDEAAVHVSSYGGKEAESQYFGTVCVGTVLLTEYGKQSRADMLC